MTKVATMGTSSCATIAIQNFKGSAAFELNEAYLKDKNSFKAPENSAKNFYLNVLHPIAQDLGRSDDYPFDALMDEIDVTSLKTKFIIATLNEQQREYKDRYWEKRLLARGFCLIDATKNVIGQSCFIYTRNNNRIEI